jgi:hypothetical protein
MQLCALCSDIRLGNLEDLTEATIKLQSSVNLTPKGLPALGGRLYNLADCLREQFYRFGYAKDSESALQKFWYSVASTLDR